MTPHRAQLLRAAREQAREARLEMANGTTRETRAIRGLCLAIETLADLVEAEETPEKARLIPREPPIRLGEGRGA